MINFNKKTSKEDNKYFKENETLVFNTFPFKILNRILMLNEQFDSIKTGSKKYTKYFSFKNVFIVHPNQIVNTNFDWTDILKSK
jgi:hypothetical protein